MNIHKFGGASVKDVVSIKRMADICKTHIKSGVIVVSAMGKTTNLLEDILQKAYTNGDFVSSFMQLSDFYISIMQELFDTTHCIFDDVATLLNSLNENLQTIKKNNYDFAYDQTVSIGEIISTKIISAYFQQVGFNADWQDIRKCLKTNDNYREAVVNWETTSNLIKEQFKDFDNKIYVTQGFIGMDSTGNTTTLGREGSDYTAAIFANVLDAEKVTVWKDVSGILCADPIWFPTAQKLDEISYLEAIELTYFGAKVIHPKTIKPLQNKNIPLQVRSFLDTSDKGTTISNESYKGTHSIFTRKQKQVLITIKPLDFSFIVEENLSHIFYLLAQNKIKVNIMQNSAISFNIVTDEYALGGMQKAISELRRFYDVKYNDNMELISIRYTTPQAEEKLLKNREVFLEQRSRSTVRFVVR